MSPCSRIFRETVSQPSPSEGVSTTTIPMAASVSASLGLDPVACLGVEEVKRVRLDSELDTAAAGGHAVGVDPGDHVGAVDDLLLGAERAVHVRVGPELLDRLHGDLESVAV